MRARPCGSIMVLVVLSTLLAAPRAPAQAQGLTSLNFSMSSHNFDGMLVWIAQDKHLFEKYGLSVNIIEFQGGAKGVVAMAAGEVPIGSIGATDIINARSRGIPLQMIAGVINKFAFDFVVAKNVTSPAQLKGTKGAISSFGGSSDFAIRYALTTLGINPQEVTLLQVGDETARLAALQSGQIQFTVLSAGIDLVAFDLGFKPLLKLYALDQPFAQSGVGVNTAWANTHPAVVNSFLRAIVAAMVFVKNPLNIAAALALIHKYLPMRDDQLKQGFEIYRDRFFSVYPLVSVPGMEFILHERKITQPVTDFYDNSYVQSLQNANFAAIAGTP